MLSSMRMSIALVGLPTVKPIRLDGRFQADKSNAPLNELDKGSMTIRPLPVMPLLVVIGASLAITSVPALIAVAPV